MSIKSYPWPKVCSRCGKAKPIAEFSFIDKAKGTRKPHCKTCRPPDKHRRKYDQKYYQANKKKCIEASLRWQRRQYSKAHKYSKLIFKECDECHSEFVTIFAYQKYCSERCMEIRNNRYKLAKYMQDRREDIEKVRLRDRLNKQKKVKSLCNSYIKHLLIGRKCLSPEDIPPPLVDLKRTQLTAVRLLRTI